jgi:kynureninase
VLVDEWEPAGVYLNTASYGLPPRAAFGALEAALADWRGGRTGWRAWHDQTDVARASWARIAGCAVIESVPRSPLSAIMRLLSRTMQNGLLALRRESDGRPVLSLRRL